MKKKEEFPEPNYAQTIALHLCKCYKEIGGINLCLNGAAYCYDGNPVEDIDGNPANYFLTMMPYQTKPIVRVMY